MTSQTLNSETPTPGALPAPGSRLLVKVLATEEDWAGLVLRLTLGAVMFPHAAQKAFGWFGGFGFQGTVGYFESIGIPAALGTLVILVELCASVALVAGAAGRIAALGIMGVMVGAILKVHAPHGFFMNWSGTQAGEGFEFHLLVLAMAAALVIRGSGALSLDGKLTRVLRSR